MGKNNAKALRYKAIKNILFGRQNGLSILFINRPAPELDYCQPQPCKMNLLLKNCISI